MGRKRKYRFSLRLKLVLFTTVLAIITYSTSAFFLYYLVNYTDHLISPELFTIITLLLGIFWSGVLAFVGSGFLTRALQKLETAAYRAAEGHIDENVPIPNSDDEIKGLSLAFNQMLANMRTMVKSIEANFQITNENVNSISSASKEASVKAETISNTVQEISRGAEQSASSIQATADSVEEMIEFAAQVEEQALSSEQLSKQMVISITDSKKVFDSLISGIQSLAEDNEESMSAVRQLELHANEVSTIVALVGDIANQTNLLALNASIEAARAGEHGRGFAVVADEVRKLADESAKAVQGITRLIQNIQQEVHNVAGQIVEQVANASAQAHNGSQSANMLEETSNTILEVAKSVQQISSLVQRQMNLLQSTGGQSREVAAIAQETSAGAQEAAAAITEQLDNLLHMRELGNNLTKSAEELRKTIDRFVIETIE